MLKVHFNINNILLIFDGSETQLLDFHKFMNSINENFRSSIDFSQHSINYLDLTIFKGAEAQLHTTLFRKVLHATLSSEQTPFIPTIL